MVLPDTDYPVPARPGRATPSDGILRERPRIATILIGIGASGTERRMACVFEHLSRRQPGRHLLIVNRDPLSVLLSAGPYGISKC